MHKPLDVTDYLASTFPFLKVTTNLHKHNLFTKRFQAIIVLEISEKLSIEQVRVFVGICVGWWLFNHHLAAY